MSGGTVVIKFEDMVNICKVSAGVEEGSKPKHEMMAMAPSYVVAKAVGMDTVELHVPKRPIDLWSDRVRNVIDNALAHRKGESPATLKIVMI